MARLGGCGCGGVGSGAKPTKHTPNHEQQRCADASDLHSHTLRHAYASHTYTPALCLA